MSVIAHLSLPSSSFELGRILEMEGTTTIVLETMVPMGERAVPFFSVHDGSRTAFEAEVRGHPSVEYVTVVSRHGGETLYALEWAVGRDQFFQGLFEADAHLLSGAGSAETWEFELRFPDHEALSAFQSHCADADLQLEVGCIYNPTRADSGRWYGLTYPQRETLIRAVEGGYYSIPRRISTQDLAREFDISDQAVTERLRRAIVTLTENTLIAAEETDETIH